ncbi:hypothetical protein JCM11251_006755 [Rhodosporidiobolus azoricus]
MKLRITREDETTDKTTVILQHGNLKEGRLGKKLRGLSATLFSLSGGIATPQSEKEWPVDASPISRGKDSSSGENEVPHGLVYKFAASSIKRPSLSSSPQPYRLQFVLQRSSSELDFLCAMRRVVVGRLSDLYLLQLPPRLRFFFPNVGEGAELWVSSDVLAKAAPYSKDLLASGFSENTPRPLKRARSSGDGLHSPLRSTFSANKTSDSVTRRDFLEDKLDDDPSLPLPVSPKSMYRLADLLRLPDADPLTSLCLRAFANSLTHHGAALELFSDVSNCFEPFRKIALDYVITNWHDVSETASWKEKMAEAKAGELPEATGVMVELLEAREEATKQRSRLFFSPLS